MVLVLDEDTRMLRESAQKLFAGANTLRDLRRWRDAHDLKALTWGQWQAMVDLGLPGVLVPECHGGAGLGWIASIQVSEMMGRTLALGPFLSTAVMAATALEACTNAKLADANLPLIAAGKVITLAAEEKHRHQPLSVASNAKASGDSYRIDGSKVAVIDGNIAEKFIVTARDESGELLLFLIDARAAGVSTSVHLGVDSKPMVEVRFDQVQATRQDLLCGAKESVALLERVYDAGRLHLAAEMFGAAREAFDRTVDYMKTRMQFGKPIGSFQALQHRAAILFGQLEIGRAVVLNAAVQRTGEAVSLAKARVGDIARHALNEATQLHGGIGMTDEFDMHFFLKRVRVASELFGDSYFHADRYASLRGL